MLKSTFTQQLLISSEQHCFTLSALSQSSKIVKLSFCSLWEQTRRIFDKKKKIELKKVFVFNTRLYVDHYFDKLDFSEKI